MTPFLTLTSTALPLLRDNVDTDAIIPSREINAVSKRGLSGGLFAGWRYTDVEARTPNPDFVLNDPAFAGAQILLGGVNFGCGSSREHAVWALAEFGFRAVIADSFNPIFQENCVRNGVLPIALDPRPLAKVQSALTIDLPAQVVSASSGESWAFEIDAERKAMLVEGLDQIALTLRMDATIAAFQRDDAHRYPWIALGADRS